MSQWSEHHFQRQCIQSSNFNTVFAVYVSTKCFTCTRGPLLQGVEVDCCFLLTEARESHLLVRYTFTMTDLSSSWALWYLREHLRLLPGFHWVFSQREWVGLGVKSRRLAGPELQQGGSSPSHPTGKVDILKCGMSWIQGLPTKHLRKHRMKILYDTCGFSSNNKILQSVHDSFLNIFFAHSTTTDTYLWGRYTLNLEAFTLSFTLELFIDPHLFGVSSCAYR